VRRRNARPLFGAAQMGGRHPRSSPGPVQTPSCRTCCLISRANQSPRISARCSSPAFTRRRRSG
jgi:hypothetical protein